MDCSVIMTRQYAGWKTNKNGDPIEGTDRIFLASNRRLVLQLLAFEEQVELNLNASFVICKDGSRWYVRYLVDMKNVNQNG
jgi:hypothetical protein